MSPRKYQHFGIGEALDGSFIPDDDLSPEALAESHEKNAEAAREAVLAVAASIAVSQEHIDTATTPTLSDSEQIVFMLMSSIERASTPFEARRIFHDVAVVDHKAGLIDDEELEQLRSRLTAHVLYMQHMARGEEPSDYWLPYSDK